MFCVMYFLLGNSWPEYLFTGYVPDFQAKLLSVPCDVRYQVCKGMYLNRHRLWGTRTSTWFMYTGSEYAYPLQSYYIAIYYYTR